MKLNSTSLRQSDVFILIFLFLIISSLLRMLFPFGDEPDFLYRINEIIENKSSSIIDYLLYIFYGGHSFSSICPVSGYVEGGGNYIPGFLCGESLSLKLTRIIYINILFLVMAFCYITCFKFFKEDEKEKFSVLLISLFFPSLIYYLGVAAEESLSLYISLFVFVFINRKFLVFVLAFFVLLIDKGSGIVVLSFIGLYKFNFYIFNRYGIGILNKISILIVSFFYFIGMRLLSYLDWVPIIGDKAKIIYHDYSVYYTNVADKYPLIIRPMGTYFTGVFMTPSGICSLFLFLFCGLIFLFSIYRMILLRSWARYVCFLTVVILILSFVFVLPGFSNAKYYIFMLPCLIYSVYRKLKNVFLFSCFSSLSLVLSLLFSRLPL